MAQRLWNISQLRYNPCTGEITKNGRAVGSRRRDGYIEVTQGRYFNNLLAHRVAWRIIYGRWPTEIDHIDGNPSNNSIWNLREVSHQANLLNQKRHREGRLPKRRRENRSRYRPSQHLRS